MNSVLVFAIFGLFFTFLHTGHTLQCWKCSSDLDITCRDHFNVTRILQNRRYTDNVDFGNRQLQPIRNDPHMEICDDRYTTSYDKKNVCLKRVHKSLNGIDVVRRECHLVSKNLRSGECPSEVSRGNDLTYCQTCDYDGCNSATSLQTTILATSLPVILLYFLRK